MIATQTRIVTMVSLIEAGRHRVGFAMHVLDNRDDESGLDAFDTNLSALRSKSVRWADSRNTLSACVF